VAQVPALFALELVMTCPISIMNQTRGLAIWAVGQMGMIRMLRQDRRAGRGASSTRPRGIPTLSRLTSWQSACVLGLGTLFFRSPTADQQRRQTPHDKQQPPKPQPPQPPQPQPPQPQPLQPQPRPRHPPPLPQPWHPPQPLRASCVKPPLPFSLSNRWNVARLTSAISSSPRTKR
jgi:hypothetical protein